MWIKGKFIIFSNILLNPHYWWSTAAVAAVAAAPVKEPLIKEING